jgi:hypothetical protein
MPLCGYWNSVTDSPQEVDRALLFATGMTIAKDRVMHSGSPRVERAKTHPILIVAGVAVLLFSLLGAAALTGVGPGGQGGPSAQARS